MRIRTIKPEFFTHEAIYEAELESGLPLRLAFIGLWCAADREGRFKWEPRRLGVSILPYDSTDFSRVLDALTTRGFVVKYRVGNVVFGCIPSFTRHQVINNREAPSSIPESTEGETLDAEPSRDDDACPTRAPRPKAEGKGRKEGEGEQRVDDAVAITFPLVLNTDGFRAAWSDWEAYRREARLPKLKPRSIDQQLAKLAEWGELAAIDSIRDSIRQQWQGLFEPKGKPKSASMTDFSRHPDFS